MSIYTLREYIELSIGKYDIAYVIAQECSSLASEKGQGSPSLKEDTLNFNIIFFTFPINQRGGDAKQ